MKSKNGPGIPTEACSSAGFPHWKVGSSAVGFSQLAPEEVEIACYRYEDSQPISSSFASPEQWVSPSVIGGSAMALEICTVCSIENKKKQEDRNKTGANILLNVPSQPGSQTHVEVRSHE